MPSVSTCLRTLPALLVHADWSKHPGKRLVARAWLGEDGIYTLFPPQAIGNLSAFLPGIKGELPAQGWALLGFDFPIGLPQAYARQAGITDFLSQLPELGQGEWADFFDPAETSQEIRLTRPFYPARPGRARRGHLVSALGLETFEDLYRECERRQPGRRAACPLFWTLGAQQVGKAAICGWREVLVPGLRDPALDLAIWPFSGRLAELAQPGKLVIAETYPAEYYPRLAPLQRPIRKRLAGERRDWARRALAEGNLPEMRFAPRLEDVILDGFTSEPSGEDAFDAFVGLLGMLALVTGRFEHHEPVEPWVRHIEGWILGMKD